MTPSITEKQIINALGDFITTITGIPAVQGQVNRVASLEGDYAVMWPLRRPRLATNVDSSADAKFIGSIAGQTMTITEVDTGSMNVGATVFGVGVAANTVVGSQLTGDPGGVGTYSVSPSQNLASTTLSAGQTNVKQATEFVMQCDVHGAASGDNAQTLATLFRDQYAVDQFAGTGISPLYADDPRQTPFVTAANQYEDRWTVDLHMQIDPIVSVPQQYADQANVTVISVTEAFPA
jgi:hypothetical protein